MLTNKTGIVTTGLTLSDSDTCDPRLLSQLGRYSYGSTSTTNTINLQSDRNNTQKKQNYKNTFYTQNYTINYTISHKANRFYVYPTSDTKCEAA